jgi:peptidylprolyl isomerase
MIDRMFGNRVSLSWWPLFAAVVFLTPAGGQTPKERPDGLYAEIQTAKGLIVARLEMELTPMTVANFVGLAEGTIDNAAFDPGRPFYDGTVFHRVVPGHVIQGGAPQGGRARNTGYNFPNEIQARLNHGRAGMLNMANAGPHTNSSQFCFMLGDRSYLDGDYTVFGELVDGMDVVMRIAQGDAVERVRIVRLGAKARLFRPTTESFRAMVREAEKRVADHVGKKLAAEREWIARNHPKATALPSGVLTERLQEGTGPAAPGGPLSLRYRAKALRYMGPVAGWQGAPIAETAFVSDATGKPGYDAPEVFPVESGKTKINPGLDEAIASMSPGERRIVIVPAALGYGRSGAYPPEVAGKRRYAISPHTMLVYEVEAVGN